MNDNIFVGTNGQVWNRTYDAYAGQMTPSEFGLLKVFNDVAMLSVSIVSNAMGRAIPLPYRIVKNGESRKSKVKTRPVTDREFALLNLRDCDLRDVQKLEDPKDELYSIVQKPNRKRSWRWMLTQISKSVETFGYAFVWKETNEFSPSLPVWLWLIPALFTRATYEPNGIDLKSLSATKMNDGKGYLGSEIIDFYCDDGYVGNPYIQGFSPLRSAYETLNINFKYQSYLANMFDNSGNPTGVFATQTPNTDMADDAKQTLMLDFKNATTRRNSGSAIVVPGGYTFTPITMTAKDIGASPEAMRQFRNTIAANWGIPNDYVDKVTPTRAAWDAAQIQFFTNCINDRVVMRDDVLTRSLAQVYDEQYIFATLRDYIPVDDDKKRADFQMLNTFGAVKKNEVRLGFPEYGFEASPEFDETATKPAAMVPSLFADAEPVETDEDDIIANNTTPAAILNVQTAVYGGTLPREAGIAQLVTVFKLSQADAEALLPPKPVEVVAPVKAVKTKAKKPVYHEGSLASILQKFFYKQQQEVLKNLSLSHKAVSKGFNNAYEYWEEENRKVKGLDDVPAFFDLSAANAELYGEAFPVIQFFATQGSKQAIVQYGLSKDLVHSHELKSSIRKMTLQFCDATNKTTLYSLNDAYAKVRDIIEESTYAGDRLEDMRKAIAGVYQDAESFRSYRISKTQSDIAHAQAQQTTAVDSGVVKGKTFLESANSCEKCKAVANENRGIVRPLDYEWSDNPYVKGLPIVHPLCRCSQQFVLDDSYQEALNKD